MYDSLQDNKICQLAEKQRYELNPLAHGANNLSSCLPVQLYLETRGKN